MRLAKLGAGAESYYLATVAAGLEDHRPAGLEPDGAWLGAGSAGLALGGSVGAAQLVAVLAGSHPASGELLNPAQSRVKVVGYDLVFAAPKSVSILFGVADERASRQVQAAHEVAVGDALGYLERTAVSARRQAHGTRWSVPTSGVIAAGFVHRTSRLADPHLHSHVLVSNLVEGDDGRWTALDARGLYAHGVTAGYLYQARLRLELVRSTGVAFGPVSHGVANLAGVDPAVLAQFSQRRGQVLEQLAVWGTNSPHAAQAAALTTRPPKETTRSIEDLRDDWRRRAEVLGLPRDEVKALLSGPQRAVVEAHELDAEAITAALVERTGSFGRRELLRAVAQSFVAGAEVATIEGLSDTIVASGGAIGNLQERPEAAEAWRARDGRRLVSGVVEDRWTTRERLGLEAALLGEAAARAAPAAEIAPAARVAPAAEIAPAAEVGYASGPAEHQVREDILEATLARRPELSSTQVDAVRHLVRAGSRLEILWAGPGPIGSDVLDAAREAWQLAGFKVLGLVGAAAEASELESAAGVLSHVGADSVPPEAATPSTVVLVSGAQGLGVGQLSELLRSAGGAKVVLVAEPRTIGPGRTVLRQMGKGGPAPLAHEAEGRTAPLGPAPVRVALDAEHRVLVGPTAPALRRALVDDWWSATMSGAPSVMVARTRAEVAVLNGEARARMREAGQLGELVQLGRIELAVGDCVQLNWGQRRLGLNPQARAKITGLEDRPLEPDSNAPSRVLVLRSDDGVAASVPLDQLKAGQLVYGYAVTPEEGRRLDQVVNWLVLGGPEVMERIGPSRDTTGKALASPAGSALVHLERDASGVVASPREAPEPTLSHYVLDPGLATRSSQRMELAEDRFRRQLGRSDQLLELGLTPTREPPTREPPTREPPTREPPTREPPVSVGASDREAPGALGAARGKQLDRARSLADLGPELQQLRTELLAGLPPDPTRQLADLADERAAVHLGRANAAVVMPDLVPRWDSAAGSVAVRQAELEQALARRQAWVLDNQPGLVRYGELTNAVEERRLALGRVAEVMGQAHVLSVLGPRPVEATDRADWREAAGAIDAFRERWGITDPSRAPGHDHAMELSQAREQRELERTLEDARRRLGLDRGPERERGVALDRGIEQERGIRQEKVRSLSR